MNAARPQPPQNPPPVQRLRVRYGKRGRARFSSHRDFSRAFERALRRAGIPMALTSGFNQHPRISYVNASATGAATEAEYLEIGLSEYRDPWWVQDALTRALPDGMDVLAVVEASGPSLVDLLTASCWRADIDGVPLGVAGYAVQALLARAQVLVERQAREGVRSFDARGAILALESSGEGVLTMVLRHGTPLVRPDDVVQALARVHEGFAPGAVLFTRLSQGEWRDGEIRPPF